MKLSLTCSVSVARCVGDWSVPDPFTLAKAVSFTAVSSQGIASFLVLFLFLNYYPTDKYCLCMKSLIHLTLPQLKIVLNKCISLVWASLVQKLHWSDEKNYWALKKKLYISYSSLRFPSTKGAIGFGFAQKPSLLSRLSGVDSAATSVRLYYNIWCYFKSTSWKWWCGVTLLHKLVK